MALPEGIFIVAELAGPGAERVRELQRRYDPKLAASSAPHVTLSGSSGLGTIPADTTAETLHTALDPVARATAPLSLPFGAPHRFMQTDIVVLPLDPHGPLRELHERIGRSGLEFGRPRFPFSPHVTLSLYPRLTPARARELLTLRVAEPAIIDRLRAYRSAVPSMAKLVWEAELGA